MFSVDRRLVSTVLIIVAIGLTGCAAAPGNAGGGTITRTLASDPNGLDPHGPAGASSSVILSYLFDTLVYRDVDNSFKPYLAESWQVASDGRTVDFKLRSDVKFQDGTPLDASAVVFTFERFKEKGGKSPSAPGILDISKVEAVDPTTVRFRFAEPSSTFMGTLALPYSGIVSPTAAKAAGDAFAQQPVGSGAFKLEKWQSGTSITLVRNPDYRWGPPVGKNRGAPYVERLEFKIVPDAPAQLSALQAGNVDMVWVNEPSQLARLKQDEKINLVESGLNSLIYLGFNCRKAPLDDVNVRQALSHAVNKPEMLQTAVGGVGKIAFAPLAETLPGFDPSLKSAELGFDLGQARSGLMAAGFAAGADGSWSKGGQKLALKLVTSTRAPNPAIATILQSQLKALGVAVEVQALDSAAAMDVSAKGQYDLLLWRYDWNDADVLQAYLGTDRIGRTNRVFYSNPKVDQLLASAGHEMDTAARKALYVQAQQLILADAPWQPLYTPTEMVAIRKQVENVSIGYMGRALVNDARVTGR
jgi:peptide/nickel transport system substrate-binding protein